MQKHLTLCIFSVLLAAFMHGQDVQVGALHVEIPTMKLASEVKAYMHAVLSAPIPADYVLPEEYREHRMRYEDAVALVGKRYPEFNGKEDDQLLRSVKDHPLLYQSMILEARAVRETYFQGTQLKEDKK
ncbi:MAG: hypothetical protein ACKO6L_03390 [Flavobacteriales bacterium]